MNNKTIETSIKNVMRLMSPASQAQMKRVREKVEDAMLDLTDSQVQCLILILYYEKILKEQKTS